MRKIIYTALSLLLTVVLALVCGLAILKSNQLSEMSLKYENTLKASLRQATNDMRTVENDLSKLMITVNEYACTQLLATVKEKSASCARELSRLPIVATGVQNTLKLSNQISSYCDVALKNYSDGEGLPRDFDKQIKEFFETCRSINAQLNTVEGDVLNKNLLLLEVGKKESTGIFSSIDNDTVEYPSVIFDGPFSDGQARNTPKTERGEITIEEASETVKKLGIEWNNAYEMDGTLPVYTFENGASTVQITKQGGLLLMLLNGRNIESAALTDEQALEKAEEFVEKAGYKNVKNVWKEFYGNAIVFNFVPVLEDAVIYPDIFKVKVALDNGEVVSFEGKSFVMNNQKRELPQVQITKEEAKSKLKNGFNVESSRLAIISVNEKEQLTWEFFGNYEGLKFAVYVSAIDGSEKASFRILNTDTGEMAG